MAQEDQISYWKEYNERIIKERNELLRENERLEAELKKCQDDLKFKGKGKS